MMNPISRTMPKSENRIALIRADAGPKSKSSLEVNPIAHPVAVLRTILRALLRRDVATDVLIRSDLVTQAAGVGVRGKTSDLINLCKIFAAHSKCHVSGKLIWQRKTEFSCARGDPLHAAARKSAARPVDHDRPRPVVGQIEQFAYAKGEDMCSAVPKPMLL